MATLEQNERVAAPWLADCVAHVIDDDAEARTSAAVLLRSMGLPAETYPSAEDYLERVGEGTTNRGVVLLDLRLLGMNGIELLGKLSVRQKSLFPVVMVSAYADVSAAVKALELGAHTLLTKPYREQELWDAVVGALRLSYKNDELRRTHEEEELRLAKITEAEQKVLDKILSGSSNKQIAMELDISLRTVDVRKKSILKKLGADSLPELVWLIAKHKTVARQINES